MKSTRKRRTTVHIVNHMAPGGIETLVLDLMRTAPNDERVVVFSLEGTKSGLIRAWPALNAYEQDLFAFEAPSGRRLGVVPKLRRALRELKVTKVFAHHIGPLLYGGLATRLAGVRSLIHVEHDAWHYNENPGHERIFKWCERLLWPRHFAVSKPIQRKLLAIHPKADVVVVPPGIDTQRFQRAEQVVTRDRLGLPTKGHLIGTAGRLATVKGHCHLIDALALLDARVHLVLVGDGDERANLEAKVRALELQERVTFLGHRDDMAQIYPGLDVFCLPSLNEGLPRAVIEAQACGIPVVASDVGALNDAVCQPPGRLTKAGDANDLAAALGAVLAQATDGEMLRAFVKDNYDFAITRGFYETCSDAPQVPQVIPQKVTA